MPFSLDGSVGGDDEMSNRFLDNSNHFLFIEMEKKQLCEGIKFLQMVQFDASQSLFRPNYFEISEFLYLAVA